MQEASSTRNRILAAAERLFAVHGIDRTTLRAVTTEAAVNLAAVNYHFGSKEALVHAVFDDLARKIAIRRIEMLDERKAALRGRPLPLEDIALIFLEPYLLHDGGRLGALLMQLIIQHAAAPSKVTRRIIASYFDKVAHRFGEEIGHALPRLSKAEIYWRYYFMVSTVVFSAAERSPDKKAPDNRLAKISGGAADTAHREELARQLIAYVVGGLSAPSAIGGLPGWLGPQVGGQQAAAS